MAVITKLNKSTRTNKPNYRAMMALRGGAAPLPGEKAPRLSGSFSRAPFWILIFAFSCGAFCPAFRVQAAESKLAKSPNAASPNAASSKTAQPNASAPAGVTDIPSLHVTVGDMDFSYVANEGASLDVFGVPVFSRNSVWVSQKAGDRFYALIDQPHLLDTAKVEDFEGGKKITLRHQQPKGRQSPFLGIETYILKPGNLCAASLEFKVSSSVPAYLEWELGEFSPEVFSGRSCAIEDADGQSKEIALPAPKGDSGGDDQKLASAFKSLKLQSRIGEVVVKTNPFGASPSGAGLRFDFKRGKWSVGEKPSFWIGYKIDPIPPGQSQRLQIAMEFPRSLVSESKAAPAIQPALPLVSTDRALDPAWKQGDLVPKPKQFTPTGDCLPLPPEVRLILGVAPSTGTLAAAEFLSRDLKHLYGISTAIYQKKAPVPAPSPAPSPDSGQSSAAPGASAKVSIILGDADTHPAALALCENAGLKPADHPEAYCLYVNNHEAAVAARSQRGVLHGVTSLLQLIQVDEKGVSIRGAKISDYPSLNMRGVHCLTGKGAGAEIAHAVRELLARHKMNTLVWESQYIIWDSAPELEHAVYGMKKDDARKVVESARENQVDIIPLIQSLGHSEWIFTNGKNLDLAEDPEAPAPFAYQPTNPNTYNLIFKVYQEAVDFFRPKTFHIGHDEVTMRGRFPSRSASSGFTSSQLILQDTHKLHDWFSERSISMMLWGDMFLFAGESPDACLAHSQEEANFRRNALPKDAWIADWHYAPAPPEKFQSLQIFKSEGMHTAGAGWFDVNNIRNLAKACVDFKADGYLQTTWAGFNFKIDGVEKNWLQYWAYLWAAYYSWTGENTPEEKLSFRARDRFLDLWFDRAPVLRRAGGFQVDMRPAANRAISDSASGSGWIGLGPESDLSNLAESFQDRNNGEANFQGVRFSIRANEKGQAALMLAGRFNPPGEFPREAALTLADSPGSPALASEVHFLLTAARRAKDGAKAGQILFTLANGSTEAMPLIYGENIFAFNDYRMSHSTWMAWRGKAKDGRAIALWDAVWRNPNPKVPIKSITVQSAETEAAPILLAITGARL